MTDNLNDYEYVNHRHIIITHIIINAYDVNTIGMYLHGFEICILSGIDKRSSLGERLEQAEL